MPDMKNNFSYHYLQLFLLQPYLALLSIQHCISLHHLFCSFIFITSLFVCFLFVCMHACMHACMHLCVCVCVYVYFIVSKIHSIYLQSVYSVSIDIATLYGTHQRGKWSDCLAVYCVHSPATSHSPHHHLCLQPPVTHLIITYASSHQSLTSSSLMPPVTSHSPHHHLCLQSPVTHLIITYASSHQSLTSSSLMPPATSHSPHHHLCLQSRGHQL